MDIKKVQRTNEWQRCIKDIVVAWDTERERKANRCREREINRRKKNNYRDMQR